MSTVVIGRTPAEIFALVFGVVYLAIGLLGFAYLGGDYKLLGIFGIDLAHNIAHLAIAGLLLFGSRDGATAKRMNLVVGILYLVLAIVGFAGILEYDDNDLLRLNQPDNFLHIATAALALYFGTVGAGPVAPSTV